MDAELWLRRQREVEDRRVYVADVEVMRIFNEAAGKRSRQDPGRMAEDEYGPGGER